MPQWTPRKTLRAWAIIDPEGHIHVDSTLETEERAWEVALGWPSQEEIEGRKKEGWKAVIVTVIY
jgi:hypothetical protein